MGHQIVKQPNGLYAIWSSVVDNFIIIDATPEDIIQDEIEKASKEIRDGVEKTIAALDKGEKAYYQFTKSFQECVDWIAEYSEDGPNDESLQMLGLADPKHTRKRIECKECDGLIWMPLIREGIYGCPNCKTENKDGGYIDPS